jgi:dissimilatory sulfite reductase flavoprotein subunit
MGLLKKKKKLKPLRTSGGGGGSVSALRPVQMEKSVPCIDNCPSGTDIRGWMALVAQRDKMKISEEQAIESAWRELVTKNPFPATMGRVCPHPCETNCNRVDKDGAVSINCLEQYIGDWAIDHNLALTKLDAEEKSESLGVIGAGPAGLSFAYQLARRGYKVTVYEKTGKAGGMLYWGIPFYRLPANVLQAEIQRIEDMGVEIKLNTTIGKDITVEQLNEKHAAIFLGIGAHKGRAMKIPGEEGPNVWTGTEYLYQINDGEKVDVGKSVVVIGGGDTAVDAARAARRAGADVTILYRRTRTEMPAIDSEIEDALQEDVKLELLVAPVEIKRTDDKVTAIVVRKMELGEPDDSGRRRPVPIEGSDYEIAVDSVVAAISQNPDWSPLSSINPEGKWITADEYGMVSEGLWAGGDVLNLGLATIAVGQGRCAAEALHAKLRGEKPPAKSNIPQVDKARIKMDFYESKPRAEKSHRPVEGWLSAPDEEIAIGLTNEQFLHEISRCFSCGLCFGCENCWMYCTPSCFKKLDNPTPGNYYSVNIATCDGCSKCKDECPCGFLDMV